MSEPGTLTVDEAADALGISPNYVYRLIGDGRIPAVQLGGRLLIPESHLVDSLAGVPIPEDALLARIQCSRCGEEKAASQIAWGSKTTRLVCYPCNRSIRHRNWTYNTDVEVMLAEQGGRCAICREAFGLSFAVDHDHACCPGKRSCGACVRGLLCVACNGSVGVLEHRPAGWLSSAADYLRNGPAPRRSRSGSVRLRGSTWMYVLDVGTKDRRKQETKGGFPTREAAEAALADRQAEGSFDVHTNVHGLPPVPTCDN